MSEIFLGLKDDPYTYNNITDIILSFKTRNKGKNEYLQNLTYNI
jgi:hypothetical protein